MKTHSIIHRILLFKLKAIAFMLLALASFTGTQAQTIAFTNATIETMGPGGKIDGGTLVVKDGKILEVGKRQQASVR